MKMKKLLSLVLVTAMVATMSLTGCGDKKEEAPAATPDAAADDAAADDAAKDDAAADDAAADDAAASSDMTIVVMPKLVGIPYFNQTGEGAEQAGKDLGINVIYNGPTTADAAEQVKMLEDYITQGVDAICVAPNDAAALDPVLKKAREAGIKVLDWDTEATKDLVDASVHQIDDQELGEHLVKSMVDAMGTEEGEYAIVTGGLSASNLNAWIKYAREYADANYPDLKLVADPYPTDEKQDVALSTTKDILKAYPDLKGIIAVSTPAPIGAAQAIAELGLQDQVAVVGTCVKEDCQEVLADGSLDLGCLWNTQDLGYLTVCVAKALVEGKTLSDGMELDGWDNAVKLNGDKDVILGPPEDYTK